MDMIESQDNGDVIKLIGIPHFTAVRIQFYAGVGSLLGDDVTIPLSNGQSIFLEDATLDFETPWLGSRPNQEFELGISTITQRVTE